MQQKITCHLDPSDVAALVRLLDYAENQLYNTLPAFNSDHPSFRVEKALFQKARELARFFQALEVRR